MDRIKRPPARHEDSDIDQQAAEWFVRSGSDRFTSRDNAELKQWLLLDPRHRAAFDHCRSLWQQAETIKLDPDLQRRYRQLLSEPRPRSSWMKRVMPVAASLFMVLGLLTYLLTVDPDAAFETAIGEQRIVKLEDGSMVKLNTDTRVAVEYDNHERRIHLLRGQAFFSVARDPERPLTVYFDGGSVTAVGTQFDVYKTDDEVKVTVVEGVVKVRNRSRAPDGGSGSGANEHVEEIILAALPERREAHQVRSGRDGISEIENRNPAEITAWQEQKFIFENSSLDDVVEELNRYSHQRIILADDSLKDIRVSGVFQIQQHDTIVHMIVSYFGIRLEKGPRGELLLYSRPSA